MELTCMSPFTNVLFVHRWGTDGFRNQRSTRFWTELQSISSSLGNRLRIGAQMGSTLCLMDMLCFIPTMFPGDPKISVGPITYHTSFVLFRLFKKFREVYEFSLFVYFSVVNNHLDQFPWNTSRSPFKWPLCHWFIPFPIKWTRYLF